MKKYVLFAWACFSFTSYNNLAAQSKQNGQKHYGTSTRKQWSIDRTFSCTQDTIILTSQAQINNFSTVYATCTTPKYLFIDGTGASPAITNLNGLSSITQIVNKLVISNTSITSLAALSNLTYIGDALQLDHNPSLTNIGLNNITQLGSIIFVNLPSLTSVAGLSNHITGTGVVEIDTTGLLSLSGLNNIQDINGDLHVGHSPVANLNGLSSLSTIEGNLYLDDLPSFTSVTLNSLTQATGLLFINLPQLTTIADLTYAFTNKNINTVWMVNTHLQNLSGLDSLYGVNEFLVNNNLYLTSLHGLEHLTGDVSNGFQLYENPLLTDISALSHITLISGGTVQIGYNDLLGDLTGLGNIIEIGGGLWIKALPQLTTLGTLNPGLVIHNDNGNNVIIIDNNSLSLCSFPPICNYLAGGGDADIHNNDPGCNDIAEIQANCGTTPTGSFIWTGALNDEWNNGANWLSGTVPTAVDSVLFPGSLAIYPYLELNVTVGNLILQNGSEIHGNGFTITVNGSAVLDHALINGNGALIVNDAMQLLILNSTISSHVEIHALRGNTHIYDNTITGNTVIDNHSSQSGDFKIDGNTFNGNLFLAQNSHNDFSEGTGSSTNTANTINGNADFLNNSGGNNTFRLASGHGLHVSGNLGYTSTAISSDPNNADLFITQSSVDGNFSVQQQFGLLTIGYVQVGGTVNINADSTQSFIMHNLINSTAGGSVRNSGGHIITYMNNELKASIACTGITGKIVCTGNTITGNSVFADSAAAVFSMEDCNYYSNLFDGDLSITKNTLHNYTYENANTIKGNAVYTNHSTEPFLSNFAITSFTNYWGNLVLNANNSNIFISNTNFKGNANAHLTYTDPSHATLVTSFLIMNKSVGDSLILDQDVSITGSVTFNTGIIKTSSNKSLIFRNSSNAAGGNDNSFVQGPVKKAGALAGFNFPVGDSSHIAIFSGGASQYNPTDTFTVEYFKRNPTLSGYDTASHVPGIGKVSAKEYWMVNRNVSSSTIGETILSYNVNRSGPLNNVADLRVARWDGTKWVNEGNGGTTGNTTAATVRSTNQVPFGPFTLAFYQTYIPRITVNSIGDSTCFGIFVPVSFTVDSAMQGGNIFKAELSDSSGSFTDVALLGQIVSSTSGTINAYLPQYLPSGNHYRIRVIGTNPIDTSINAVGPIVIGHTPQSSFFITGLTTACLGNTTYGSSAGELGITYTWTLSGGGTITPSVSGTTAVVNWTTPGLYTITLKTSTRCGIGETHSIEVTVVESGAPTIVNAGRWLYVSQVPAVTSFIWYKNGVTIPAATSSSYYAAAAGNYTVKYNNLCGISPASNTISFAAAAVAQTINFPIIANKLYNDAPFTLTATATSGLPVSFAIESGPAVINTQTNLLTITGTGLVTVRSFQLGDMVYDTAVPVSRSFTVNKAPQVISFPAIPNQQFGNPPVQLMATSNSGLPVSYSVITGNATVAGNMLTITGIGTIIVRALQTGDTNYLAAPPVDQSFCSSINNLSPIAGYTHLCPGTTTYTVNNIPGATYLWRIAGGNTLASTTNTANVTWPAPGIYSLIVSASGNCGSSSINDTLVVDVISSILPDSVHSMLPVDGSVNQQLPLTLSWIPADPTNYYTYDVYVWLSTASQPATPFAANLTSVSYTIPLNSGLAYNKTYKWMVVAHNGSCIPATSGPIQQFTLIPLPDLVVSNIQTPSSAFSGQTISIGWTVSNPGPGRTNTNQSWTDAVFLSFDSIPNFLITPHTDPLTWSFLNFPVRPLLVTTRPNVSALDSGQHYTNSINFTLPINYSQPLYAYVITNYPSGINAPLQVTTANDTLHSTPIIVTLSPTPDLRVDTVFTPSTTFSGSTINVTYKVKNYGALTPATSSWYDKVYISQSPLFNINSAILLKSPKSNGTYYANAPDALTYNTTQLQADSFYTRSLQVVMPNYIYGTYFIYVFTNDGNLLYEGGLNNNNVNRSQVQIFLTPTPHLTVSTLTIPTTTASTTQPIGVNWNISNTGFNDNIEKNKGHYYVQSGLCEIAVPCYYTVNGVTYSCGVTIIPGKSIRDSISFGSSYWIDKVYLSTNPAVLDVNASILVNEVPHGILNAGLNVPDNYFVDYPCQLLSSNPANYNVNTDNVIRPGSTFPGAGNFVIPANLPAGDYYVYVLANSTRSVYEYPGTPETRRSALPISVQRPDVIVPAITVPANIVGGQSFAINYSVKNNGPGTVFNSPRKDNIYVSSSPVFDASAQLVKTLQFAEDLPVGVLVPHTTNYTFPVSFSGTRYFYVHTNFDSTFRETNATNNISSAAMTTVTAVIPNDLTVTSIQLADSIFSIIPTYFKYTVHNAGTGTTAGAWIDSVFISCSPVFNPATSYWVARRSQSGSIPGGSDYVDSFNLNIQYAFNLLGCFPQTSINNAYFFVKTNADNGVYEGPNNNNNITGTSSRVFINTLVDHIVTTVNSTDSAIVGRPYTLNWTVKNIGYLPNDPNYYNYWADAVYFASDSILTPGNVISSSYNTEGTVLNTNQTYNDSKTVTIPNVSSGEYYVFVVTNASNSIYGEKVLSNNINMIRDALGKAKSIHIQQPLLPDLTDSITLASTIVATGQPLTIKNRIKNKGAGATYPATWGDAVWLSADFIPGNAGDILLAAKNHSGILQPGEFYNDSTTVTISLSTAPGNYILISQANATGSVFESDATNNLSFRYVTIFRPAPADLIVENIMTPDSVFLGYTLDTAKWVIRNIASNSATGFSADGIYLSTGTVLDSTTILLGIKNKNITMSPLSRDTISVAPLVTGVTEGTYHVIVKTDLLNNITESNKDNNTGIAATTVYVKVKELPLNILLPNTLYNINRFYKLVIPDSLNGATIQVVLRSGDSLTMRNQLFIGKNYIPSAAHFDYTYSTPNYGNQDIVMAAVTPGVYYIMFRCVSPNPVVQNITLKAVKLPFAILNVHSASGGNIGNVTIKITGSLFTNNMTATLSKPGTTITASAIYFTNSTTVYATFNLQGRPLGIYDVTLTKPDTTVAVLLNGFSVVLANNGGLITGGGPNTGAGNGNDPGCDPGAASGLNSQLSIEVVAPEKVFTGWPFIVQVNYNNPTNYDIPAQVRILYNDKGVPMALTPAGVSSGTSTLYLELTEQNGPPGIIRAGGSGTITVYAKAPVTLPAHTKVSFNLK